MTDAVLEDLQFENLKIYQPKLGYRFTSDSVILANFVKSKPDDKIIEFCSGCGVIAILLQKKLSLKKIYGIELQKELFDLSMTSLKTNFQEEHIFFINDKIQNFENYFKNETFDIVVSNPPYFKSNAGLSNKNSQKNIARHDLFLSLEEFIYFGSKALKFGGNLYFCYDAKRISEILVLLNKYNMAPKEIFFSQGGKFANPSTIFIKAQKGAKLGTTIFPNLITNDGEKYLATIPHLFNKE